MTIVRCANGMFPAYKDVGRMSAYGGAGRAPNLDLTVRRSAKAEK